MSLQPDPIGPAPDETARVARTAFPKGSRYLQMRDALGTIFADMGGVLKSIDFREAARSGRGVRR